MNGLELKIPPLAQGVVVGLGMWLISAAVPELSIRIPGAPWLAVVLVVFGVTFALAGVYAFQVASTTVDPMHPEESSSLVTGGVYRWSRNPMYVGFLGVLCGWAVVVSHVLAFALLPVFVVYMNRFQIVPEERFMRDNFGEEYEGYVRSVRRWL